MDSPNNTLPQLSEPTVPENFHCGYVGIVGRPNTGKSSLFNLLIGSHISGVSPKAQTTRIKVMGWLNLLEHKTPGQLVFLDTPGFLSSDSQTKERGFKQQTLEILEFANIILMMVDCRSWRQEDEDILALLKSHYKGPIVLLLNKIDRLKDKDVLLATLAENSERHDWLTQIPISVTRSNGLAKVIQTVWRALPASPPYYSLEKTSLQTEEETVIEHIRENIYYFLHQEIPYKLEVCPRSNRARQR